MSNQMMLSTQVGCQLALNVVVKRNGCPQLFVLPLLSLTSMLLLWWRIGPLLQQAVLWLNDLVTAVWFTAAVVEIGLKSVAWGVF